MQSDKYERLYSRYENVDRRHELHTRNIEDINLLYLQGLRELAIEDASQAAVLYGVTEQAAHEVAQASIADLKTLAAASIAVFRLQCKKHASVFRESDPKSRMAQLARIIK